MHKFITRTLCGLSVLMFAETTLQAMDLEDLRSRYLTTNPGGRVMQRDNRLKATVEIINSDDISEINTTKSWLFTGPLPYDYQVVLTEPILTAFRSCPMELREKLAERQRRLSFTFDIGGNVTDPVIGQAGYLVNDKNGIPGRCVTIIDKNDILTDIFW